jgi:hypothetical protein
MSNDTSRRFFGRLTPGAELKRLAADAKEVGQGMSAEETFCHQTTTLYSRLASTAKPLLPFPLLFLPPNLGRPVRFSCRGPFFMDNRVRRA